MIINQNIPALNTLNRLNFNQKKSTNSMEKLASGLRINKAGDDAAGLAISEKMRGQIRGLNMAGKNIQDGISLIQTAEGAMNEIHSLLQRGRELSVQSANDTNTPIDRLQIQKEIDSITSEITDIGNKTEFNTQKLLDGSLGFQKNPSTPQSSFAASGFLSDSFTVADGWVNFGYDSVYTVKGKLNSGEQVVDDKANGLHTTLIVEVSYNSGIPESITLKTYVNSEIIVQYHPDTIISYNGFTIDVSNDSFGPNTTYKSRALIALTPGNNDAPINNDIDNSLILQTGANSGQNIKLEIPDIRSAAIGIDTVSVLNNSLSQEAITAFNKAINKISSERGKLGAYQNRLEHTYNNVMNTSENLQSSESRIRDTPIAKEMMEFTKNNILIQASQAMLAQANQKTEGVLQLLK